jgi:hypothetical protein
MMTLSKSIIKLVIVIVMVLNVAISEGQISITGKITDSSRNKVLGLVTVTLKKDTTIQRTILSDNLGQYSFKNLKAGLYNINYSFINYKKKSISFYLKGDTVINISLTPFVQQLKEVVVNTRKPLIERKIDRIVFNVKNSMASLRGDALDVLSITPGVNVQNEEISIIGKGSVSLMVNGKSIKFSGVDLITYLKSIPSDVIEKIEVISNPTSRYSAEGNSGLINLQLKKYKADFWAATLRSVYSQATYPTGLYGANYDYKKGKATLSAGGDFSDGSTAAIERPVIYYPDQTWSESSSRRDYTKKYSGRILADYDLSKKLNIGTQLFYSKGIPHTDDNSITNITKPGQIQPDSILIGQGTNKRNWNNLSLNLNTTYKLDTNEGKLVLDLDYYNSSRDNNRIYNSQSYDQSDDTITGSKWYSNNSGLNSFDNYSINLDIEHKIKSFIVNYGGKYSASKSVNNLTSSAIANYSTVLFSDNDKFVFNENTGAFFFSVNEKIRKKIEAQVGLRVENTYTKGNSNTLKQVYTNSYLELFPTFYLVYTCSDNNVLVFNYGRRIERPSYPSLNPFKRYINQNLYSVGNPFLLPVFINNFELSYDYKDKLRFTLYANLSSNNVAQTAIPNATTKLVIDTMQNCYNSNSIGLSVLYIFRKIKWLESINQLNGYYAKIDQKIVFLPQTNNGYTFSASTDNTIKLDSKYFFQIDFWYTSSQYMGIYKQSERYDCSLGFGWHLNAKVNFNFFVNDIFKTSQSKLYSTVNSVQQYYNNYYDNRYLRFTLQYKIGNTKIKSKQRNFANV